MRLHHLNCGTMCPICRRLVNGDGSWFESGRLICHCLLIVKDSGDLILVDGGFGLADCADKSRFPWFWRLQARPVFDPEETAIRQIEALGLDPAKLNDIILTHLDRDHCGAMTDFPAAKIHVSDVEWRTVFENNPPARPGRYLTAQMSHGPEFVRHNTGSENWFGLEAVYPLGSDVPIVMVALYGHTPGHCGVAVKRDNGRWLLHAGDAVFNLNPLRQPPREAPVAMKLFEKRAVTNDAQRLASVDALKRISRDHADEMDIICSHDLNGMPG